MKKIKFFALFVTIISIFCLILYPSKNNCYAQTTSNLALSESQQIKIFTPSEFENLEDSSSGLKIVKKTSSAFDLEAQPPSSVITKCSWYLKTANSNTFDLFASSKNTCTITPSMLVNNENGFGVYKIYATCTSGDQIYYSTTLEFIVQAGEFMNTSTGNRYIIATEAIPNTKAQLSAYNFTLKNASFDSLDFQKIQWRIDDQPVAIGENFKFEPTSNKTVTISAYYENQGVYTVACPSIEITPTSTGGITMIIVVVSVVALFAIVFFTSTYFLNKKRDVTW